MKFNCGTVLAAAALLLVYVNAATAAPTPVAAPAAEPGETEVVGTMGSGVC